MPEASPRAAPPAPRTRRVWVFGTVLITIGVLVILAFVPYGSASQEIQVAPGGTATAGVTVPHAGWVTIHFSHPSRMGMTMHYWVRGSGGMMFDHSMMGASDSYSFWSWGGTYDCGAGYDGSGSGVVPVWFNSTWGML